MDALNRFRLPLTVFVCGAVVMAYELVGSRVLAPAVGSSLFVWTSLIGIILASLSFGYWYGGRVADRWPSADRLALVIWVASAGITVTALFHQPLLSWLASFSLDQRIAATVAGLVLFAPASIALGMVSPYAARLAMHDVASSGSTIGSLYAASTVGSIAGTFLTGWVLIGYLGTTTVLYLLSAVALAVSFVAHARARFIARLVTLVFILALANGARTYAHTKEAQAGFIDVDTQYQRAQILLGISTENGRTVRYFRTDPLGAQSSVYLDGPELVARYTQAFDAITASRAAPSRALTIGGGALVWPSKFIRDYPVARMDVVEIDPALIGLAEKYFRYLPHPGLRVIHEDGRTFLNTAHEAYDLIFTDAFAGTSIPVQLTTQEAVLRMSDLLSPGGLLVSNVIGAVDGPRSHLTRAMVATYRSVFSHVVVVPLSGPSARDRVQNVLVLSSHEPFALPESLEDLQYDMHGIPGAIVLTDEYAPVERLAAALLR